MKQIYLIFLVLVVLETISITTGTNQEPRQGCENLEGSGSDGDADCFCTRQCWGWSTDNRRCIPMVESSFEGDSIIFSVPKCAVGTVDTQGDQSKVSLGNYHDQSSFFSPQACRYTETDADYRFSVRSGECGVTKTVIDSEVKYSAKITIWVEDQNDEDPASPVTRSARWYTIHVISSSERGLNVQSAGFRSIPSHVSVYKEDPFPVVDLNLNFYKDISFQEVFSEHEYPVEYYLSDDIAFTIVADSPSSADFEISTSSCVAEPTNNSEGVTYTMFDNGCSAVPEFMQFASENTMENKFSIKAFHFKHSLNSAITFKCTVVVCRKGVTSSTCTQLNVRKTCEKNRTRTKRASLNEDAYLEESAVIDGTVIIKPNDVLQFDKDTIKERSFDGEEELTVNNHSSHTTYHVPLILLAAFATRWIAANI